MAVCEMPRNRSAQAKNDRIPREMTTEITLRKVRHSNQDVPCAFAVEGLCEGAHSETGLCADCARYNELLRRAVELYGNVRWVLTPEGQLYGLEDK